MLSSEDENALEGDVFGSIDSSFRVAPGAGIYPQSRPYSDGTWAPEQLIEYLVSERFGLIAITDHDRVDTVASLQQLAAEKQLPILAAVEMSTSWKGEPTDVLCYGFDPAENELHDLAQDIARRQRENTREVYENLRKIGYTFANPHELVALLEKPSAQQPHELVALLKKQGYGTGEPSAGKLITDAGFLWATNDIAAAVDAAHRSGAVRFLSLILERVKDIRAMMHVCSMSSARTFPLMAWRSIILLTRQNRWPCIGNMQRHTVY